ncbi:MAG: hypothetical protein HY554_10025, partial [Elusimicrobia bacterium]|nr:hypothetical protein [Elusimicrobiota bacterium]
PLPLREPERVGELLRRFGADAEEFYWTIEREAARRGSAVRLAELETFLWSYSERLDRAVCPPPGRYCKLEGRLLDAALVPAARAALAGGGLERVRETLGGFQAEPAQALRKRLAAWVGR